MKVYEMAKDHKFRLLIGPMNMERIVTRKEMKQLIKEYNGIRIIFKSPKEKTKM